MNPLGLLLFGGGILGFLLFFALLFKVTGLGIKGFIVVMSVVLFLVGCAYAIAYGGVYLGFWG